MAAAELLVLKEKSEAMLYFGSINLHSWSYSFNFNGIPDDVRMVGLEMLVMICFVRANADCQFSCLVYL
jgi:hypothetical protein